jgi:uncharacterized protein YecE (DUF72 family)
VYPADEPVRRWFAIYTDWFDTVELNTTFYRLPSRATVDAWAQAAPRGFRYAAKLGQYATHRKKLSDPRAWLANHLDRMDRLGPARGPTLVQLPPRWKANPGRLDDFLALAPTDHRWAVEVRDPSWLSEAVFDVLRDHQAALCIHDLLPDHPRALTASWTYLRFHGPDAGRHPYRGAYTGRRLRGVADWINDLLATGHDVYAYFNNDVGGAAVADARWLRDHLA